MLQLSDFHVDLTYTVGNADSGCGQILCCTDAVGKPNSTENSAGHWGGYLCDSPIWMFQDMLEQIAETHTVRSRLKLTYKDIEYSLVFVFYLIWSGH